MLLQHERISFINYFEQVETLCLQIQKLINENLVGSKVRAKIEILNDEDNPSHFFFSKNKINRRRKLFLNLNMIMKLLLSRNIF